MVIVAFVPGTTAGLVAVGGSAVEGTVEDAAGFIRSF